MNGVGCRPSLFRPTEGLQAAANETVTGSQQTAFLADRK